jgi:membrane protease YdiL (CAAX protease family)
VNRLIRWHSGLAAYFLLAFLFSWSIEVPLAFSIRGSIPVTIPPYLHYLASFGPFFAAVVVTLASRGFSGLVRLLAPLLGWRLGRTCTIFVLSPIPVFLGLVLLSRLMEGSWPDLSLLGQADYLPYLGILPVFILWTLTYGMGEEVGWRGFALPRLQAGRSAFKASLILGAFWAVWHIPVIFYRDTYQEMGFMVLPMLLTVAAVGSVVYTWLYNSTGGSLFGLVLFHGLFDYFSVWEGSAISPGMVMTILMVFWAVRVYKIYGPATLSPMQKVII